MSTSSRGTWQKLLGRHAHESGDSGPPALASASAIRAYLRLRPASAAFQAKRVPQSANIDIVSKHEVVAAPSAFPAADTSSQSLVSSATRSSLSGRAGGSAGDAEIYTFTEVLPEETSQSSLYDTTARPLIENSLGAGPSKSMSDSLILTYGVSGGGKTYTVQGTPAEPGLLPRTLSAILRSVAAKQSTAWVRPARLTGIEVIPASERYIDPRWKQEKGKSPASQEAPFELPDDYEYAVWCSFVEVYNENVHDLFSIDSKPKNLSLKQDHKHSDNKFVAGATTVRLWSETHASEVLERGLLARHRSATRQNETSSRSHSIFTIQVLRFPRGSDATSASTAIHMSRLSVVDLAGSERARNTQTHGDRLKEAGKINQSLMILGRCFEVIRANDAALARGKQPVPVPFRHSKLTEVLKPFFCGHGEIVMVAAVDPYRTALDENINVLRFTSLAKQIKTNYTLPHSPSIASPASEVPHYSLPTRSGRSLTALSIAKPLERIARHASISSEAQAAGEAYAADESLVSFVNEDEVDDDASDQPQEEDPLVSSLFEEIRQLRQDAVQKEFEFEMAIHRVRQEERDRYSALLEEQRQQMMADADYQRELMEDLMDRKIDNMKISYDKMVGLLQQQLKVATETGQTNYSEDSVELDNSVVEISDSTETSVNISPVTSKSRNPLAPSKPSSFRQATLDDTNRTTTSSEVPVVDGDGTNDIMKSQSNHKRQLRKAHCRGDENVATLLA